MSFAILLTTLAAFSAIRQHGAGINIASINPGAGNLSSDPPHGTTIIQNRRVVYTPAVGFVGVDTFTYTLRDAAGQTATATVSVTVAEGQDDHALFLPLITR